MKYISSYMLASLGGNQEPSAEDLKGILGAVGISADDLHLNNVITALKGKSLSTLIAEGKTKIASVPTGGSPSAVAPTTASDTKPAAKKEEPKEESDDDMGFGLFD